MRCLTICLLGVPTITAACQPLMPSEMNATLASPKTIVETNKPALVQQTAATPPIIDSQNNSQTKTKLVVDDIKSNIVGNTILVKPKTAVPQQAVFARKAFNPKDIIGFEIPVLIQDLGHAPIIRKEGPIEIWQYHFTSCVVDFFFYPIDVHTPKLIAKTVDMRSSMIGGSLNSEDCHDDMNIYHKTVLAN